MTGREGTEGERAPLVGHGGEPFLTGVVRWMQEGVVLQDPSGRIVEATPAACQLLGVPEERLLGTVNDDVFGPEPTHPGWRMIDLEGELFPPEENPSAITMRSGAPARAVVGVSRPDGSHVWLALSSVPMPVDPGERPWVVSTFVDVTARVDAEKRLSESEQRFRLTLQHAPIGMAIVALDGTYLEVNPELAKMLGRTPQQLVGTTFQAVTHPDDLEGDLALSQQVLDGRIDSFEMEKRFLTPDGSVVWGHLAVAVVRDPDGRPLHFVSQVEDITESRRARELLAEGVLFDPLTGLANRVLTADRLRQAIARNRRAGRSLALLCCGIDGLKRVNDSLGHGAGDALIAAVGARIVEAVGVADRVGRGDGDEFFVVAEGIDRGVVPVELIERINGAVSVPVEVLGHELRPAVSIGVALEDDADAAPAAHLLHDATTALYEAKGRGRGDWALFERRIRARAVQRLTIESELGPAMANGELELHYQPIVDLDTRVPVAYEALARWRHPRHGLIMPARFIPVAEETGMIGELGEHVVDLACGFLGRHAGSGVQVFVNVSPSQLGPGSFPSVVAAALDRHGVEPTRLGIELTESSVLHATGSSYRALQQLAEVGIDLVLDDFGTGYSAIAALLAAPIRGIKLDRSFTSQLGMDPQADLVTRALGGMVEALGFRGVVEGVETEAQCAAVRSLGWRLGQGWLFGRPVPEGELALPDAG
jgi:PAS domain S-box-containing protein/diguanylate cyclase (GGDEF)-like protein